MAKRSGNQKTHQIALVLMILLLSVGTIFVDITIGRPYFNITQNANLSQLIGRSDLNSGPNWFNATTSQQPAQLMPSILQQPSDGELSGSQSHDLLGFLQETPEYQAMQLPAFLQ